MLRIAIVILAVLFASTAEAQQPAPTIATLPAQQQAYVAAYGAPQPIWRTPIRTGLWRAIQPRGFYTPTYAVPVGPQNVQHFCPTCRQYHQ